MEINKYLEAKELEEEISEIRKLIRAFNNNSSFDSRDEFELYEAAIESLYKIIDFKNKEFKEL